MDNLNRLKLSITPCRKKPGKGFPEKVVTMPLTVCLFVGELHRGKKICGNFSRYSVLLLRQRDERKETESLSLMLPNLYTKMLMPGFTTNTSVLK